MSKRNIIEGVSQLVENIQQRIDNGSLTLSTKEWIKLDKSLNEARSSLKANKVTSRQLEDIAWLMISAFEENKTIAKEFADELKPLVRGTKLTGRGLRQPKTKNNLIRNKTILIKFTKTVKEKLQTSQKGKSGE